jgi:mannose-6-phosphate isomerase
MKQIRVLNNPIQNYAWGSHTALAELMGRSRPTPKPEAELWMGAHPKAPSQVSVAGQWHALPDWIASAPGAILGREVCRNFNGQLPYLFKVLAIDKPLSIQAHPNRHQASQGFAREQRLMIPLDAPNRNYKDPNHKPECLCALTDFHALCGFRPVQQIIALMGHVCLPELDAVLNHLGASTDAQVLRVFFQALMTLDPLAQAAVIRQTVDRAWQLKDQDPAYACLLGLHECYPDDIGVLAPLFLNLIVLAPDEALYLPAGELHAYLHGVGVELMANSDNVLRGGLTPKHVDLPELLKVLNFSVREAEIMVPEKQFGGEWRYPTPATEFALSTIQVGTDEMYRSAADRSIEMLLCVQGRAVIATPDTNAPIEVGQGTAVVVPAAVPSYTLKGQGKFYKAAVPITAPAK